MVALGARQSGGARLKVVVSGLVRFHHPQISNFKYPFGNVVDRVVAGEPDLPTVFIIVDFIVSDPVHHLYKDILAVHQLVVIPFSPVVKIFLHKVRIGMNVGNFKIQVIFQLL